MSPGAIDAQVKDLEIIIKTVEYKYTYIKNLETIEDEDWSYDHVIIFEENLRDQRIIDILKKVLKERPDITVIIAFEDDQRAIDDEFYINRELVIKNLVITSRSLIQIGHMFLFGYGCLKKLYFPDGLIQIGAAFLVRCIGLVNLNFPDELNIVGAGFLADSIGLTSVQLPNGLTIVGDNFLFGCIGLTSLELPAGLTTVGNNFLNECVSLTSLELPYGLTLVGSRFLYSCIELKQLKITKTLYEKLKIDHNILWRKNTRIIFY